MGNSKSKKNSKDTKSKDAAPKSIKDSYETMEQFTNALRSAGLEKCNLLVALDFTKSNTWQGVNTFNGKNLHYISETPTYVTQNGAPPAYNDSFHTVDNGALDCLSHNKPMYTPIYTPIRTLSFDEKNIGASKLAVQQMNPYQYVLSVAGSQLEAFDEDGLIPTCIFGYSRAQTDPYTKLISKVPGKYCYKMNEVIEAYEHAIKTNGLSGNTQFAPIINWAMGIVNSTQEYHILLIIGDGCIDDMEATRNALAAASKTPLSIVFVGVGDGSNPNNPKDKWSSMRDLDDNPSGDVDNWQSVYLANIKDDLDRSHHPDIDLAVQMFMEIPEQYQYFKSKGMIRN